VSGRFTGTVFVYSKLILVHNLRNKEEYYHVLYLKVTKEHIIRKTCHSVCLCVLIHF